MLVLVFAFVGCSADEPQNGKDGINGKDGSTPYIEGGYWYIDGVNTGVKAEGTDGTNGTNGTNGENGKTPYIEGGYWYIDGVSTGVKAEGADGQNGTNGTNGTNGENGKTPYIEGGYWYIDGVNTGVKAGECEHSYPDEWTTEIEATCESVGVRCKSCTLCGKTEYEFISATPHDMVYVKDITLSCTDHVMLESCSGCGHAKVTRDDNFSEHIYAGITCEACGAYKPSEGLEYEYKAYSETYAVVGLGTCTDTTLVIPKTHEGVPVSLCYLNFDYNEFVERMVIHSGIENAVDAVCGCAALKEIILDGDNPRYSVIDGNLYSKDETVLYWYAPGKEDTKFIVPDSVTEIRDSIESDNLQTLTLGKSVSSIYGNFLYMSNLTDIYVDGENTHFKSDDGVLYTADGSVLMAYPSAKAGSDFRVPDSVIKIKSDAFYMATNLKNVILGESVEEIGACCFSSLESIVIPKSLKLVSDCVFEWCSDTVIYYTGAPSDWSGITFYEGNDDFQTLTRYYYSETNPGSAGNYWHYDENGNPVIW